VSPVLVQYGWTEAELRRRSPEWAVAARDAIFRHRGELLRVETAALIQAVCIGTVGAYSEEGQDQMRGVVDELLTPPETTGDDVALPYDMDPNAKPDEAALAVLATGKFPGTPAQDATCNVGWRRISRVEWETAHGR
jgi:hypothetical protein